MSFMPLLTTVLSVAWLSWLLVRGFLNPSLEWGILAVFTVFVRFILLGLAIPE
jgi:hypothetical protein